MAASRIVGNLRVNLGLDASAFTAGIAQTQTKLKALGTSMRNVGLAVSAAGAGIGLAIRSSVNRADELTKLAQKIGVPVEELSQLEHVANLSGLSLSQLQTGVAQLSRQMVEGNDAFAQYGVAVADAEGALRPTSAVLADLANVFQGLPDGAEKTALAMELLGRSGAEMIPMLNAGGDAISQGMAEAADLGLTVTRGAGQSAENLNDNVARMQAALSGLANQVAQEIVPVMVSLTEPVIALARAFGNLSPEMRRLAAVIASSFLVGGPVLLALGAITLAISAISAPVLAAVAAFAAITAGLIAFGPQIMAAKDAAVSFAAETVTAFNQTVEQLVAVVEGLPARMVQIGADIIEGLKQGLLQKYDDVKGAITGIADGMVTSVTDFFGIRSPSRLFRQIGGYLMDGLRLGLGDGIGGARDVLVGGSADIAGGMNQIGTSADSLSSKLSGTFANIVTGATSARNAINQLANSLLNTIMQRSFNTILAGIFPNADGNVISGGRVQAFAKGGVVTGPTLFGMQSGLGLMGEAGPEAILPLRRGPDGALGVSAAPSRIEVVLAVPEGVSIDQVRQIAGQQAVSISARTYSRARREGV